MSHKLITSLLALIFFLQSPGSVQAQIRRFANPEKDYWKDTGLRISDFIDLEIPHCQIDQRTLTGCLEAFNALLAQLDPPLYFGIKAEKRVSPFIGNLVNLHPSGFNFYSLKKFHSKNSKIKEEMKEVHQEVSAALVKQAALLPFDVLFKEFNAQFQRGKKRISESAVAADLFNRYFSIVIDPHSLLRSKEEIHDLSRKPEVEYVGIGIQLFFKDDQFIISQVSKDSGAFRAGIKFDDVLKKINGQSVEDDSIEKIRKIVSGIEGSKIHLTVLRNRRTLTFEVTRHKVKNLNKDFRIVEDLGKKFAYLHLRQFIDQVSCNTIKEELNEFKAQTLSGLILDLRGNPGGEPKEAQCIGGLFVGQKLIFSMKPSDSDQNTRELFWNKVSTFLSSPDSKPTLVQNSNLPVYSINPSTVLTIGTQGMELRLSGTGDEMTSLPMVTLIDSGSASASEIVAGALQDYKRSWIVGDRSYGKGTIQGNDGFQLATTVEHSISFYKTYARFYQPSGRTNQIVGIEPEFLVPPFPNAKKEDFFVEREEDHYTALPPKSEPWTIPADREVRVKKINQCREQIRAELIYRTQARHSQIRPDYPLLVAQEILDCESLNPN